MHIVRSLLHYFVSDFHLLDNFIVVLNWDQIGIPFLSKIALIVIMVGYLYQCVTLYLLFNTFDNFISYTRLQLTYTIKLHK